jgi:phage terminase small subunit
MTPQQEAFVREYLIDLNATQAAIRAGYSAKTAGSQGERLLKNVEIAEAIKEAQAKRAERTEITADRVLQEYARIAFYNPGRIFRVDENGLPQIDMSNADEDDWRVVAEVANETTQVMLGEDQGIRKVTKAKVKHQCKLQALNALAKHLGMMTDKIDVTSAGKPLGEMSADEIERKALEILSRRVGDSANVDRSKD